ncbi:MAG: permease-like cell division protein FtsX [Bacillota bacterium]|nr:permease-like cell division protein FtsX [Bacillota bacterium]
MFRITVYCIRQAAIALVRNFWLGLASAGMIAVSLCILGAFLLVALNANQWMRGVESEVEINVFLAPEAEASEIGEKIEALSGVTRCTFVPKSQALREMRESLGDKSDILEGLEEDNPLPDSYRVQAARAELVPAVAEKIEDLPGVDRVNYGQGVVEKVIMITRWLNIVSLVAAGLLAAAAVFLIVTTVRLSVVARQQEISIMKFLGASNWFVRAPFLMEGMTVGLMGGLAAVTALGLGYYYLALQVDRASLLFFQLVTDPYLLLPVFGGLLALGLGMGGLGSVVSMRKFLNV